MITVGFNKVFVNNNVALGNHMFQYAICRLVATLNGYNFYIPYSGKIKECFPNIDLGICDGSTQRDHNEDVRSQRYDESVLRLPDFTNISGYYQTDKYYRGNEELVKSWFKLEMDDITKSILDSYPIDSYCYIHIRGGDNKFGDNNWLLPKSYYQEGIDNITKRYGNIKFVIVTDDYDFSKSYFPDIDVIRSGLDDIGSLMVDFKLMYYSKYSIISSSSLAWWSNWLSDKEITIAPNNWLNYNKPGDGFYPVDIMVDKFTYI